ncbi:site-specific DNA-methyltransferase [Thermoactinomyces sp. CICC 23799]|uniref:DNA-methyltransferase n=1 Tax=Thermoactinomyces sp. CICC 23799 TaxID=2767429 RepID=UPI0018DC356A|nr:site-specific DNA-methyltransferase [Thermoactinomyces sp. CICC 23799]MBH8600508.1 site-specific DNA-methyltransferase [Thermoactinomyces sp. CICC 23799]
MESRPHDVVFFIWGENMERIIQGDCLEELKKLPDNSIDSIITDPPFFCPATHYQSRVNWGRKWSDMSVLEHWWRLICDNLRRVLKPTGHIIVFCNSDSYPAFYPPMFNRWDKLVCLVWDKERVGLGRIWRHQHELIIAGRNKGAYEPNDGVLRSDILRFKATKSKDRKHPVEKPVELLAELIKATTPPGGIVLDPFAGSGSTLVAAKREGFNYVGIEKEAEYVKIANERLKLSV